MSIQITIRDEIYNILKSMKNEKESFSDIMERLMDGTSTKPMMVQHHLKYKHRDGIDIMTDISQSQHVQIHRPWERIYK